LKGEIERQDPEPLTEDSSIVPSALLKVNVSSPLSRRYYRRKAKSRARTP
jgi:hypothetical protein